MSEHPKEGKDLSDTQPLKEWAEVRAELKDQTRKRVMGLLGETYIFGDIYMREVAHARYFPLEVEKQLEDLVLVVSNDSWTLPEIDLLLSEVDQVLRDMKKDRAFPLHQIRLRFIRKSLEFVKAKKQMAEGDDDYTLNID